MKKSNNLVLLILIGLVTAAVWAYLGNEKDHLKLDSVRSDTQVSSNKTLTSSNEYENGKGIGGDVSELTGPIDIEAEEFSPEQVVWMNQSGIDKTRRYDANRLAYVDLNAAESYAVSGDIYAMEALGVYFLKKDPERAYRYFYEAALYGSVITLSHLAQYHVDEASRLRKASAQSSIVRQNELNALAFAQVASATSGGFWGEIEKNRLYEAFAVSEDEVPMICAKQKDIEQGMTRDRNAMGIVPSVGDTPFRVALDSVAFTCPSQFAVEETKGERE